MRTVSALFTLPFLLGTFACSDHGHHHARRAPSPPALRPPTRPLQWGDINIIHTTDSHGWLRGHQKESLAEPNYSADLGDFASFVENMKKLAHRKNVDLLLVDSGDLHDGTGLTDGFPDGAIDGHDANQILKTLPYDVMAIGNHELYIYSITNDMHSDFAPSLHARGGHYLSSNVNLTTTEGTVPVGKQYAKFTTQKGKKITAFGVIFNFAGNDKNTTVQKVEDFVNEAWFHEAIQEEPDLFLLVGHMPVSKDRWPLVFNTIRSVHPYTPILILGGHTHVRDCVLYDGRSIGLESGQYMETVGWLSATLDKSTGNLTFSRRYLDANRVSYEFHTNKTSSQFDTPLGREIKTKFEALAKKYNLDEVYGTAPHDFTIHQDPYPSETSLLSLYAEKAAPLALAQTTSRSPAPPFFFIAQSGSQRSPIFSGVFTRNDQYTASPFANGFVYIADIPLSTAQQLVPVLNGVSAKRELDLEEERRTYELGYIEKIYNRWLEEMALQSRIDGRDEGNLTLGYVTTDSCPDIGDDIPHAALPFFSIPTYIASNPPSTNSTTALVDLVFVDFFTNDLLKALNTQTGGNYTVDDVKTYTDILVKDVFEVYAKAAWN